MDTKYREWIDANYPTKESAYGNCAEATERMVAAFPELRRARGHYICLLWGDRQHWWCVAPDGTIVDPTQRQFPTRSDLAYAEWDESQPEPTGKCPNCGGVCYDHKYLCTPKCEKEYAAYCGM